MDDRLLDVVVGTHSQALADALVKTYRQEISACTTGVVGLITDWCRAPASYETAWDPAFGRAELALTNGALDPREVAVRLALRLTETGREDAWCGVIAPSTFRLGRLILPGAESIQVDCNGGELRVTGRATNGTFECVRQQATGEWIADGLECLPSVGLERSITLLGASAPIAGDGGEQGFEGVEPVGSFDTAMIQKFQEAFDAVAVGATEYSRWIEVVLRGILVTRCKRTSGTISGSVQPMPGVIQAAYPAGRMEIAEILVHESAHQYFYLLERVGPVDDGSDHTRYWSPPMRKVRPLSRILVAYHALANVRLFYESIRAARIDDGGYVDLYERKLSDTIAQLDAPLRDNPALTRLGRALYEPLARRIAALAA
jgi:HEXXH motif-containing protein